MHDVNLSVALDGVAQVEAVCEHLSVDEDRHVPPQPALFIKQIAAELVVVLKGLLQRDTKVRPQIYRAARSQLRTQRQLVGHLLDRAFSGSPGNLVLQALSTKKASAAERKQIRELLDRLENEDGAKR